MQEREGSFGFSTGMGQLLSSYRVSASLAWSLGLEGLYWCIVPTLTRKPRDGKRRDLCRWDKGLDMN